MESILQTLLVIISIMGVGLFGALWYFFATIHSRTDKSEQNQIQRFNDFKESQAKTQEAQSQKIEDLKEAQNQKFDEFKEAQSQKIEDLKEAQNQKFDEFKKAQSQQFDEFKAFQAKIQEVQNQKFDLMIEEQKKITAHLTNHVTHLQENQEIMKKDIDELKTLLQKNNKSS